MMTPKDKERIRDLHFPPALSFATMGLKATISLKIELTRVTRGIIGKCSVIFCISSAGGEDWEGPVGTLGFALL